RVGVERRSRFEVRDEVDGLFTPLRVRDRRHAEVVFACGDAGDDRAEGGVDHFDLEPHESGERLRQVRIHALDCLPVGAEELVRRVMGKACDGQGALRLDCCRNKCRDLAVDVRRDGCGRGCVRRRARALFTAAPAPGSQGNNEGQSHGARERRGCPTLHRSHRTSPAFQVATRGALARTPTLELAAAPPYPDARSAKINASTERKAASGRTRMWMLYMAALLSRLYPLDG